ncbi:MAG: tryptophan transporter [Peptostreptococcaceae bacterium]
MILICGITTGIFAAFTTKFPGGQIPNILDKTITTNMIYCIMILLYKFKY